MFITGNQVYLLQEQSNKGSLLIPECLHTGAWGTHSKIIKIIVLQITFPMFNQSLNPLNYWGRLKIAKWECVFPPLSTSTACQRSLWAAYVKDSSATIHFPFDEFYYITRKCFTLISRYSGSWWHTSAREARGAAWELRRAAAHSPRVTPVDMAAGRLDILGETHKVHYGAACYFMC